MNDSPLEDTHIIQVKTILLKIILNCNWYACRMPPHGIYDASSTHSNNDKLHAYSSVNLLIIVIKNSHCYHHTLLSRLLCGDYNGSVMH